jgi:hypothetical protein
MIAHTMMDEEIRGVVEKDILCLECRYNLRTLNASAKCPECGSPVAKSLARWQNAKNENFRRLATAAIILVWTGTVLGIEYAGGLTEKFVWGRYYHHGWAYEVSNLWLHFQCILHVTIGVLVLVATIKFVKSLLIMPSVATIPCVGVAVLHLLFYAAIDLHEWAEPFFHMRTRDFEFFWNNWCYAGVNGCEFILNIAIMFVIRKFATQRKNKALQVTSVIYPLMVSPIYLAGLVNAGNHVYHRESGWFRHMADGAPNYTKWEWVLAAATILYWLHFAATLSRGNIRKAQNEDHLT